MLLSPIIFFYGFFILLVFVIGVAPSAFWWRIGAVFSGRSAGWRRARMARRLAQAARGQDFVPDIDYTQASIGFAAVCGGGACRQRCGGGSAAFCLWRIQHGGQHGWLLRG
jgi:hypothetical protein